jgi:hypothetical protein
MAQKTAFEADRLGGGEATEAGSRAGAGGSPTVFGAALIDSSARAKAEAVGYLWALSFSSAFRISCSSTATMRKYLMDLKLFMVKAGETRKPIILHAEPGVWNRFLTAPEFRPNALEGIHVGVRASGLPELEGLDDSAVSFGKAFGILRDRYAPNVLLAWHLTNAGGVTPTRAAEALRASGAWDLLFTDVGHGMTLYELGKKLNVTRERIRQLQENALRKLQENLANDGDH